MHTMWRLMFWMIFPAVLIAGPAHGLFSDEQSGSQPGTANREFTAEQITFFRTKVKPLLEARCFECHSGAVTEPKGGLRLDSRAAVLQGGDSGPAAKPGRPAESRLIGAVNYELLEMPPRSKLPAGEIAILTKWVKIGLPDSSGSPRVPQAASAERTAPLSEGSFPLKDRQQSHWAWQPIRKTRLPKVNDVTWPASPIDRFVLAKLEDHRLAPNPQADRRTLIRRASFDLVGLPPTPEQVSEFVNDPAPTREAFSRVVERLLSSPHFGERWARHWLDLVRYADTLGHEFDYPLRHAYRYRDYVIRAFNADVPYNQFVKEHIAGDLLRTPRRHPRLEFNESVIGTGFWYLGEDKHAPVDVKADEAAKIDNRLDVFGKTFLGLTIGCARCHDHKFDAITMQDYYALAGFMQSSRRQIALLDPGGTIHKRANKLQQLHRLGTAQLRRRLPKPSQRLKRDAANYFRAAREVLSAGAKGDSHNVSIAAKRHNLDPARLKRLVSMLQSQDVENISHPLWVWKQLALGNKKDFAIHRDAASRSVIQTDNKFRTAVSRSKPFADFSGPGFDDWFVTGFAFGNGPTQPWEWEAFGEREGFVQPGTAHSGRFGKTLGGALRSPTFTITHDQILYRVKGRNARTRLIIDGYRMDEFNSLLFNGCLVEVDTNGEWTWIRQSGDVQRYQGHRAHIELLDDGDGWIAVDEIRFANRHDPIPPPKPSRIAAKLLLENNLPNAESLADRYAGLLADSISRSVRTDAETGSTSKVQPPSDLGVMLDAALKSGLIALARPADAKATAGQGLDPVPLAADGTGCVSADADERSLFELLQRMQQIGESIPDPVPVIAMTDGSPEDEHVFIRGSHENPGPIVHRRMLEAISGSNQPRIAHGSGRLQFAERLLDSSNPFPPRVMVNRLWHHLTGQGIVASVDNFGVLGQSPTHPKLLDWLATTFREDGWSVKHMIRRIMLSETYMMSSARAPGTNRRDPENLLLHRMRIRRLEGEAIRDAILTLSQRRDETMFGSPVSIHLTPFMQGRGRPEENGPLDGDGRRSIYIIVRRNFLSPVMAAFDMPIPFTTIGRRNVSNVPAQALILMNDPFVVQQAELWAQRVLDGNRSQPDEHIRRMYITAFSREPTPEEINNALDFLQTQAGSPGQQDDGWTTDWKVWSEFAHVLLNTKEFIYLR